MQNLILPRLGQTMEVATLLAWRVSEGDPFKVGDILYEVETEKAINEIEATVGGRLVRTLVAEGEEIAVGTVVGVAAEPEEAVSDEDVAAHLASLADESGSSASSAAESPPAEETKPEEPKPGKVAAMPAARARAATLGISLEDVAGSGRNDAITVEDVERAAGQGSEAGTPQADARDHVDAGGAGEVLRRPLSQIQRAMATTVSRSWAEVPQFHQVVAVDATRLLARLERERADAPSARIGLTALAIPAVVAATREVPEANASFGDDELILHDSVDVSVAVDTPRGLTVPVLRGAERLSVAEAAQGIGRLATAARDGALGIEDVDGGTITVSNLGMFGIEYGAPLVTAPQSTIVFMGAIKNEVVVVDGDLLVRPVMRLSCAFDHRVLDGATAGRFTAALARALEGR